MCVLFSDCQKSRPVPTIAVQAVAGGAVKVLLQYCYLLVSVGARDDELDDVAVSHSA